MISSIGEFLLSGGNSPAMAILAKATVALVLGLAATWLARRSRASVRHSMLAVTFGTLLLLPFASVESVLHAGIRIARSDATRSRLLLATRSLCALARGRCLRPCAGLHRTLANAHPPAHRTAVASWPSPCGLARRRIQASQGAVSREPFRPNHLRCFQARRVISARR